MCTVTVSHKSEYTPHILANIVVYLLKGQYYRNETWIYFRVVIVLLQSQHLLSSENNSTQPQQKWIHLSEHVKSEYTLSDNSWTSFNHAKPYVLFIMFTFCRLDRTIQIVVSCIRAVKICAFEYNSLIDHWMFNMATHGKELSKDSWIRIVALHKVDLGYKKIGNTLKLRCSTGQCHTEVFQDGFHSEQDSQGAIKEVKSSCCASSAEVGFIKTDAWVLPALL